MNRRITALSSMLALLSIGIAGCCKLPGPLSSGGLAGDGCFSLIRIEQVGQIKPYFALGKVGTFYYRPTPGIPTDFYTQAMHPLHMKIQPPITPLKRINPPTTMITDPGMPQVDAQGGTVYVVGTNPVATTESVAAGAEGCEILFISSGQDWYIYFIGDADGTPMTGRVFARDGFGNASKSNIGHHMFVRVHPTTNPALNPNDVDIDDPKPFNPDSISDLRALRDAFKLRTK